MLVRVKDGLYAGQVREFPSHIAQGLIASGRASNPFNEIEDAPEERAAFTVEPQLAVRSKQSRNARKSR